MKIVFSLPRGRSFWYPLDMRLTAVFLDVVKREIPVLLVAAKPRPFNLHLVSFICSAITAPD
jgi:hypothetical protein